MVNQMTTNWTLSLFISSKMQELAEERRAVQNALQEYEMRGWLWEDDAGARPEPIRSTYLAEVEACDIYIGLFWFGYGPYTIEEFERARQLRKPCLVYEKYVNIEQRNPQLVSFLHRLQAVENPDGLTVYRFETSSQLAKQVQIDVMRLLTTRFRENRQQPSTRLWKMPYRRNPFFTGREDILQQLHAYFTQAKTAALTQPPAITGLGGIGKTDIAVEYAYRHREDYRYVLWVNAAIHDTIIASYLELAALLELSEQQEQDENIVVAAVKAWFAVHNSWLLIFDNADDLSLVEEFSPIEKEGHLLLTTRAQALGTLANSIEVEKMPLQEGMLLLFRRAKVLALDAPLEQALIADKKAAEAIVQTFDGLPLAIDQAGAYIEETQCSIASYLERYLKHQPKLLNRRGGTGKQHPQPVAMTWTLSFQFVEEIDLRSADLLRFCVFLAPDAIPEQLIIDGASELSPCLQPLADDPMLLDEAIGTLLRFSLVKRKQDESTIFVHRLVQVVLKSNMDVPTQREWAERTVRAVNRAFPFPDATDYRNWQRCQQYLPHAQTCMKLIDQWTFASPQGERLSIVAGNYLKNHARYVEAEDYCKRAIAISMQMYGPEHPNVATTLNNLGALYLEQGKYADAEPLLQRAIAIGEKTLGLEHPKVAMWFANLGALYLKQDKYAEAEPLLQQAIAVGEKSLGPEYPELAMWLNNLAELYSHQGKNEQAEVFLQRAIAIGEKTLGSEHPTVAKRLNNLANLYREQGKYEQAEQLYRQAVAIGEKMLGSENPLTLSFQHNLQALLMQRNQQIGL